MEHLLLPQQGGDLYTPHNLPRWPKYIGALPEWTPDALVIKAGGSVVIRRQSDDPAAKEVTVLGPARTADDTTVVLTVDPPLRADELAVFRGGILNTAGQTYSVTDLDPTGIRVLITRDATGLATLPQPGPASLHESTTALRLWPPVATLPAADLPHIIDVTDPWSANEKSRIYAATVEFDPGGGRPPVGGPVGARVHCLGYQPPPAAPPPFTAVAQVTDSTGRADLDAYGRVLVKVTFTSAVSTDASFSVWWCEGPPQRFHAYRTPAPFGAHQCLDGYTLIDALELPIPLPDVITIGVTQTTPAHVEGEPTLVPLTMPG